MITASTAHANKHIEKQKLYYKDNGKSICKQCWNYNEDCWQAMKICGKDEKSGYSTVEKCGNFKKKSSTTGDQIRRS